MTFANHEGIDRQYGGPNGYGHRGWARQTLGFWAKAPTPKRTPFARLVERFGADSHVDLRQIAADIGIYDQGSTSSCTGNAKAGSIGVRLKAKGTPAPWTISAAYPYKCGRLVDVPFIDGKPPPLTDDGAVPEQVSRAIEWKGLVSYAEDPTDPATINTPPTFLETEHGLALLPSGIYGIASGDVDALKKAIDMGFPVDGGLLVDDAFESWNGTGLIQPPDPARILGGHAVYFVDYDDAGPWLANSWGTGWGEGGFGHMSWSAFQQVSDLEVADVEVRS